MDEAIKLIVGLAKTDIWVALFVIACGVVVFLYRARDADAEKHRTALDVVAKERKSETDAITAERIADARAMTSALEHSSQANLLLEKSAREGSIAIRDLAKVIESLGYKIDGHGKRFDTLESDIAVVRDAVVRLGASR